jgi:hypothetical protein
LLSVSDIRLRETVEQTRRAIGALGERYDEAEALLLIKALGNCDAFIGPAVAHLHTPQQEQARHLFHQACTALSTAIRLAVAYPGRSEKEARVVGLVRQVMEAADGFSAAFG